MTLEINQFAVLKQANLENACGTVLPYGASTGQRTRMRKPMFLNENISLPSVDAFFIRNPPAVHTNAVLAQFSNCTQTLQNLANPAVPSSTTYPYRTITVTSHIHTTRIDQLF